MLPIGLAGLRGQFSKEATPRLQNLPHCAGQFTHFDTIVTVTGTAVQTTEPPENIVLGRVRRRSLRVSSLLRTLRSAMRQLWLKSAQRRHWR
jgi:hypothetical protein